MTITGTLSNAFALLFRLGVCVLLVATGNSPHFGMNTKVEGGVFVHS